VIFRLSSVIRADAQHTLAAAAAATAAAATVDADVDTAADSDTELAAAVQLLQHSASRRFAEHLLHLVTLDADRNACEALCYLAFRFIDGGGVAALTVLLDNGALGQLLTAFAADVDSIDADLQRPHMIRLISRLLRASDMSNLHRALTVSRQHQHQQQQQQHSSSGSDSDDDADTAALLCLQPQQYTESPHALQPALLLQEEAVRVLVEQPVWAKLLRELPQRPLVSELGRALVHLTSSSRAAAATVVEAACAGIAAENSAAGMKPYFRALSVLLAQADTDFALAAWLVPFAMHKLMRTIDQNCEFARATEAAVTLLMRVVKASARAHAWLRSDFAREDVGWLVSFLRDRDERGLAQAARYMDKQVRRSSSHRDRSSSGRRAQSGAAAVAAPVNTQTFVDMLTGAERMWSYDSDDEPEGELYS
jgi:hypothetical protein